jgi:hypothetical protein
MGGAVRPQRPTGFPTVGSTRRQPSLTLATLGALVGYSPQHVSECELGKAYVSGTFVAQCDEALAAGGAITCLLPTVLDEQSARRDARTLARSGGTLKDVDPTTRRGLLEAGAAATLTTAVPTAAREVDPELPASRMRLLQLLDRHVGAFGPQETLRTVAFEQRQIALHREVARGALRIRLQRVEARWHISRRG